VENGLPEHDDDPRPSLIIATLVKKPYFDAGSRARHLSVFLSFRGELPPMYFYLQRRSAADSRMEGNRHESFPAR
jgi:hypothetical protein